MYKHFNISEFRCRETQQCEMKPEFIHMLDELRERCNFPFAITSGYRATTHSIEIRKSHPGTHTEGIAADIAVANGHERMLIVKEALHMGFSGIGVAKSFVHVDIRTTTPVMWVYG